MKKFIYIYVWLCFFVYENAYAQFVSQETAQLVAENFFYETIKNDSQQTISANLLGDEENPSTKS